MRRILLLLATMALALVVVGGVATSQQPQDQQQEEEEGTTLLPATTTLSPTTDDGSGDASIQGTTTPAIGHQERGARQQSAAATASDSKADSKKGEDKGSGAIPRSTLVKASFTNGSGANFLGVKVSDHGNLLSFESPAGQEQVFAAREGYAVCSDFNNVALGHDTGEVEGGFGPPTFVQPTAGAFPLTVTRKTTDGKFQLTQVWAKPDPVEKDITLTMTLKNVSGATINNVFLSRSGDFDVGISATDRGARTDDSVWQWDEVSESSVNPGVGLMLSALSFGAIHDAFVEPQSDWVGGSRQGCFTPTLPLLSTPTSVQDLAMRVRYSLLAMNAGQSKTVKYEYERM